MRAEIARGGGPVEVERPVSCGGVDGSVEPGARMAEPRPFVEGVIGDTVDITRPVVYFYHDIHTHTDLTAHCHWTAASVWRVSGHTAVVLALLRSPLSS